MTKGGSQKKKKKSKHSGSFEMQIWRWEEFKGTSRGGNVSFLNFLHSFLSSASSMQNWVLSTPSPQISAQNYCPSSDGEVSDPQRKEKETQLKIKVRALPALVPPGLVAAGASVGDAVLAGKVTSAWRAQQMLVFSCTHLLDPWNVSPHHIDSASNSCDRAFSFPSQWPGVKRACPEHLVKENNYITLGGVPFHDCQSLTGNKL